MRIICPNKGIPIIILHSIAVLSLYELKLDLDPRLCNLIWSDMYGIFEPLILVIDFESILLVCWKVVYLNKWANQPKLIWMSSELSLPGLGDGCEVLYSCSIWRTRGCSPPSPISTRPLKLSPPEYTKKKLWEIALGHKGGSRHKYCFMLRYSLP